jgi:hypothetical protein
VRLAARIGRLILSEDGIPCWLSFVIGALESKFNGWVWTERRRQSLSIIVPN